MTVRDKIIELKSEGWTLAAMSDEVGIPYRTMSDWLNMKRQPTHAGAVLAALGVLRFRHPPKRKRYARSR